MSKCVLTLDEINLLKYSEELKNKETYGNLFEELFKIKRTKAVDMCDLFDLDEKGKSSLMYNKDLIIKNVVKEWYAESVSDENDKNIVRCGLCNTPNKYIYYIKNRLNNSFLNVGSSCIKKFPGIEGYEEQKTQLHEIKKNQEIAKRRLEFNNKYPNVKQLMDKLDEYFNSIPILLPEKLYIDIEKSIESLHKIYSTYVNSGTKPFKSKMTSIELFELTYKRILKLQQEAEGFVSKNINNEYICKRVEIDWLIKNKKNRLLQEIAKNDGLYTINTIQYMETYLIIERYLQVFKSCSKLKYIKLIKSDSELSRLIFKIDGDYSNGVSLEVSYKDFLQKIGSRCVFAKNHVYTDKDIINIANIDPNLKNIEAIVDNCFNLIIKIGYTFLIDYDRNALNLYRKSDKAISVLNQNFFLKQYKPYLLMDDNEIMKFLISYTEDTRLHWQLKEMQEKYNLFERINKLYKEQYTDIINIFL